MSIEPVELANGALIGDLRRQVDRDAQRHARDIQQAQKRVAAQIPENMRPENGEILRGHFPPMMAWIYTFRD